MAKIQCKGTALKIDIATVYTAIAQAISIKPPVMRSLDFDSTTLDGGVGMTKDVSGYGEGGEFESEIFWDPELAPHAAITDNITTPAETSWQILFVNAGASLLDFDVAGLELSPAVDMKDGLKASVKGNVSGLPVITV
jgi:hypothetical protein